MKIANISTIKNELSKYLRYVQQGERVRILDRNQAIADIVPVTGGPETSTKTHLQKLEASGIIRRGTGKIPSEILTSATKSLHGEGAGVLEALLKERKEGR
ncbi:MAG: type II toxin-antitoxin system Phd/YefM family antitoxin [Deltaproteobacteria bacterium]|nr:type II toxin-antitoxin system Phd/YefM family antitoxin [Deltaproteobacteria bacterium]